MILSVDPSSPLPTFEQVREQLARMIGSGVLPPDAQLPSIRQLAADLGLAPGTIARAYQELERACLVGGRGRRGTRVLAPAAVDRAEQSRRLEEAARTFAVRARQLGADADAAWDAVRRALAEVTG